MATKTEKKSPVLHQFGNLWSLVKQPSAEKEWSHDQKFQQIVKAGFDSVGCGPSQEVAESCQKYGLGLVCYIDGNMKTYKERLKAAKSVSPKRVNVQVCDHDTLPKEAVKVWIRMEELAKEMGLEADLEVHRDTCTETPEKVDEIAKLYRKETGRTIRYCWDYSHFAVVKHLYPPYSKRLLTDPKLVQVARQFHFRPFNGHHCQIPATDGKGNETTFFKAYMEFIDELFACWFKGAKGGEEIYVCPELGDIGSGYGMSCFPNIWKDTVLTHDRTEALWKKNLAIWRKSA
jgi:hypothetical protein